MPQTTDDDRQILQHKRDTTVS